MSASSAQDTPVWFITGCSSGFGREIARLVLARGWRAIVTARNRDAIEEIIEGHDGRAVALTLDVTDSEQIDQSVADAVATFGRVDVLVNNAGYGYVSSVEEGVDLDIRAQFETNVFGLFALTRAVLPHMRERKNGHILNVTSVGGMIGYPSGGYYSATKFAVEGWSDSLAAEVGPLGIKVTCVEPGPFRTDWAGRSLKTTPSNIEAYAETVSARIRATSGNSGKQAGDPVRAGEVIIAVTQNADAPRHLVLGRIGHDAVTKRCRERLDEITALRELALAADFPAS